MLGKSGFQLRVNRAKNHDGKVRGIYTARNGFHNARKSALNLLKQDDNVLQGFLRRLLES
jgi:hypothetical protein